MDNYNSHTKLEILLSEIEQKKPFTDDSEMKSAINGILEAEQQKSDANMDCDLIEECVNALLTLDGYDLEKLEQRADDNEDKALEAILHNVSDKKPKAKRFSKKRIGLTIAACLMVLVIATPVVAYATGYDAFAIVSSWVKELFGMNPGETKIDNITIIKGTESKGYANIEELLDSENLDILYPSWLPEGVTIKEIWQTNTDDNTFDLSFVFSDNQLNLKVKNYYENDLTLLQEMDKYNYNGVDYYIRQLSAGKYYVISQHEGYEYSFLYSDYDVLIKILQNLKEIN